MPQQHSSYLQNDIPLESHIPFVCVLNMELETLTSLWSYIDGRVYFSRFMLCIEVAYLMGVSYLPYGLGETNKFELRQLSGCIFHAEDGHPS